MKKTSVPTSTFVRVLGVSALAVAGCVAAGVTMSPSITVHGQTKAAVTAAPTPSAEDNTQFFTQKVRPVLAQSCYQCHTTEAAGGLRLDRSAMRPWRSILGARLRSR